MHFSVPIISQMGKQRNGTAVATCKKDNSEEFSTKKIPYLGLTLSDTDGKTEGVMSCDWSIFF